MDGLLQRFNFDNNNDNDNDNNTPPVSQNNYYGLTE